MHKCHTWFTILGGAKNKSSFVLTLCGQLFKQKSLQDATLQFVIHSSTGKSSQLQFWHPTTTVRVDIVLWRALFRSLVRHDAPCEWSERGKCSCTAHSSSQIQSVTWFRFTRKMKCLARTTDKTSTARFCCIIKSDNKAELLSWDIKLKSKVRWIQWNRLKQHCLSVVRAKYFIFLVHLNTFSALAPFTGRTMAQTWTEKRASQNDNYQV